LLEIKKRGGGERKRPTNDSGGGVTPEVNPHKGQGEPRKAVNNKIQRGKGGRGQDPGAKKTRKPAKKKNNQGWEKEPKKTQVEAK